ncbi:MAG: cytidylate kinase-like family protein [Treponema sp.]|nr:cytidylate kinase-like family protein [Treponema sp.]
MNNGETKKFVIAIARGYGSGGKLIGSLLSEKLGIQLIDRNLLSMASVQSGISEDMFAMTDEKVRKRFYDFRDDKKFDYDVIPPESAGFLSDKNLFNWEARVLLELALVEPFIVIGRAADFVLKHTRHCFSVNIQADYEDCVKEISERMYVSEEEAAQMVNKNDKYRAEFYKTYTGQEWNNITNYDMCLNTSKLSRRKCVDIIINAAQTKFGFSVMHD